VRFGRFQGVKIELFSIKKILNIGQLVSYASILGLGVVTLPDFEVGVVEGVVSGLLRRKGEGREPRTPQFSNQIN
jgi:hypothetical protein